MKGQGSLAQMGRIVRYRLIMPLKRSQHSPEYGARGTAVGLAWAMTPLVGIQMWLVFMTWLFCKKVLKWSFSLPLGLAWTWVTNVVTLPPVYYAFYVTGQFMRGQWDNLSGYESLSYVIHQTFLEELSFTEKWKLIFDLLIKDWGVSMIIGCLPWSLVCGVGGYYIAYAFIQRYQQRKAAKLKKNLRRKNGKGK